MRPASGPEVHVRIRRLSIDSACSNATVNGTHDFGAALQTALTERLGAGADDRQTAAERPTSISQTVANAVASHVRPLIGQARRT